MNLDMALIWIVWTLLAWSLWGLRGEECDTVQRREAFCTGEADAVTVRGFVDQVYTRTSMVSWTDPPTRVLCENLEICSRLIQKFPSEYI